MSTQSSTPTLNRDSKTPTDSSRPNSNNTKPTPPPSQTTTATAPKEGNESKLSRAFSTENATKFVKAYATTWVGMSPLYLMGEALIPGRKVGTTFKKGSKGLYAIAEEITKELATSAEDVIVVMDKQLKSTNVETSRVAALMKEAGQNAIVLVTSNLEKAQSQIEQNSPQMKRLIIKNSKDVIILVDKSLKNPVVITGITKFARSKGIPRPEAMIGLASLGLAKLLEMIEKEIETFEAHEGEKIVEIDAEELHRVSSVEAEAEAEKVTKQAHEAEVPEEGILGGSTSTSANTNANTIPRPGEKGKKKDDGACVIS